MGQSSICCQDLSSLVRSRTPFSKIVVLDYYDGPVSGIVQCSKCLAAYRFEMLAWEGHQGIRIFGLTAMPVSIFDLIVEIYAQYEDPKWPLWTPLFQVSPSEEARATTEQEVKSILGSMKHPHPQLALASDDWLESIIIAKRLTTEELAHISDWFTFLGLSARPFPLP